MRTNLKYKIKPYPKGNDTRYDINNPKPVIKTKITTKETNNEKQDTLHQSQGGSREPL